MIPWTMSTVMTMDIMACHAKWYWASPTLCINLLIPSSRHAANIWMHLHPFLSILLSKSNTLSSCNCSSQTIGHVPMSPRVPSLGDTLKLSKNILLRAESSTQLYYDHRRVCLCLQNILLLLVQQVFLCLFSISLNIFSNPFGSEMPPKNLCYLYNLWTINNCWQLFLIVVNCLQLLTCINKIFIIH